MTSAVKATDQITQQNAASSEESSSAAAELSGQAAELAALVAGFQLGRASAAAALDLGPSPLPLDLAARVVSAPLLRA
ncbi:MAG TPA: hypothetical protein VFK85_01475 [Anaeromyxobacteraceae bacterium]|nr:hypothetical protein [Anaeromyxobacteraceae bacterium]